MTAARIICVGEAMVELSLERDHPDRAAIGFAGDTLNTAIYLKRCAPAFTVSYATRLGRDDFSDRMVCFMRSEGLDTSLIGRSDTRMPGLYAISTDAGGERSFSYWRDRSAARQLFDMSGPDLADLEGADVVVFSAITLAVLSPAARARFLDWLAGFRSAGGRVVFDSNYRPALWPDRATARAAVTRAWRLTDIALPSLDDEQALFGDGDEAAVVARLAGYGITAGALKRGARGPRSLTPEDCPATYRKATEIIDSTAAGDSFNAGYLAALLGGASQARALQAGHDLSLRVLAVKGAIIPQGGA